MPLAFLLQSCSRNIVFAKSAILTFLTSIAWPVRVRSILMAGSRNSCKRAVECFSPRIPTYYRFWDDGTFPKKYDNPLNLTFRWPLVASILTWAKKWLKHLRKYSLRAIERFFLRLSIPLSFWVRRCGHFAPHTRAKVAATATRPREEISILQWNGRSMCQYR